MITRILTAVVGIPLVLVLLFWPGGTPWTVFVAALIAMACWEYASALWKQGIFTHWIALVLGCAALFPPIGSWETLHGWFMARSDLPIPGLLVFALMLVLGADLVWSRRAPIRNIGSALFGIAWIGALIPMLVLLRMAQPLCDCVDTPIGDYGAWVVLWALLIIWFGDSAAYVVGRKWGGRKLAPAISPNKTWSGAIGGLIGSAVGGAIGYFPLTADCGEYRFGWEIIAIGMVVGVIVGLMGQIGDLVESSVKRELGIKDFGSLLPGHGGVLDRFDSLMFAAPTLWFLANGLLR